MKVIALPLYRGDLKVFYAMVDGEILLKDDEFGPESSFNTEQEAIEFGEGWAKQRANQ